MAQQAAKSPAHRPKRGTIRHASRRRSHNGHTRNRRRASNLGQIERLIRDLEHRVNQLTNGSGIRSTISQASGQVGHAVTSATNQVGEAVADTLTEMAGKLRTGAQSVTGAARMGTNALQRVGDEVERRPFMTVAIALGIGFLAGIAGKREEFTGRRS